MSLRWLHTDLWTSLFISAALCWHLSQRVLAVLATLVLIFPVFWAWWSCKNLCKCLWSLPWASLSVLKNSCKTSSPWDFISLKGYSKCFASWQLQLRIKKTPQNQLWRPADVLLLSLMTYNNIYELNAALFDQALLLVLKFYFVSPGFSHGSILMQSSDVLARIAYNISELLPVSCKSQIFVVSHGFLLYIHSKLKDGWGGQSNGSIFLSYSENSVVQ